MQQDVITALRSGRIAEGLTLAAHLATARPDDPQALRLLAVAQAANGDLEAAHASLDRALALAPEDAGLHYQRATLFVGGRRADEARSALAQSVGLDSNELRAYLLQAQLALWDRDVDLAEQQLRLAARVQPDHPGVLTLRGLVLLQGGRPQEASTLLLQAVREAPEDPQTRYTLGLAFLAQGHAAFAEQAFARVLERLPGAHAVRRLVAEAIRQQGRPADAADVIEAAPQFESTAPADLLRIAGELRLAAGDPLRALALLKRGATRAPDDRRLLDALIEALRRQGDPVDARRTLEAALAAAPHIDGLWSARLSFEPQGGDIAAIAERWEQAIPDSVPAMQLKMWLAGRDGDRDRARAYANRIVVREPGHFEANVEIIHALFLEDPEAAVAHIQGLLPSIREDRTLRMVLGWLGRAQDRAGQLGEAVATWRRVAAMPDPVALPLPGSSGYVDAAPAAPPAASGPGPVFLYGPPGSGVERVVGILHGSLGDRMRMDRMEPLPPADLLQDPGTAPRLAAGDLSPLAVAQAWQATLSARAGAADSIIDWLPWWDQALLPALRAIPHASLWLVLADPRDMLLDWLQRGSTYLPYRSGSDLEAARWLAGVLAQLAAIMGNDPLAHRVLRVDATADDAAALASQLSQVTGTRLVPLQNLGPTRLPSGHWRRYAEALAEPFALLAPAARALGYPED
jgi:Flp pilus assembly protein TadD